MNLTENDINELLNSLSKLQNLAAGILLDLKYKENPGSLAINEHMELIKFLNMNKEILIDDDAEEQLGSITPLNMDDTNEIFLDNLFDLHEKDPNAKLSLPQFDRIFRMKERIIRSQVG